MIDPGKDIDWNEIWKSQMKRSRESSPGRDCARIWSSKESALRFWDMCKKEQNRIERVIWETDITEKSRVLDIGAGPGTLAIPLAQKATHVTAVEPADGMCSVMREKMAEYGVENITIVQKRWEEVDVASDLDPPYDVVVASFSLGMFDIRNAIEKMIQASSDTSISTISRGRAPGAGCGRSFGQIAWKGLYLRSNERRALQCALPDGHLSEYHHLQNEA